MGVDDHVPDLAIRDRRVDRAIHADRFRTAAGEGSAGAAGNSGDGEVVAHGADARFAHGAQYGVDIAHVLGTPRTVEQNVVPVRGVEVLNAFELQSGSLNLLAQRDQLGRGPQTVWIARHAPRLVFTAGRLVLRGIRFTLLEIVNQVHDDMRATGLHGECVVFVVEHVPVESQAKL